MPIPKPHKGEKQDVFIQRCMKDKVMNKEFPKEKQRAAVCYDAWDKRAKHATVSVPGQAFSFAVPQTECAVVEVAEGKVRAARVVALSGKPMTHWFWGNMVFDLDGISTRKPQLPGLLEHVTSKRINVWTSFDRTDRGWEASGHFLDNGDAQSLVRDFDGGFPWQASVYIAPDGLRIEELSSGASAQVNGQTVKGPMHVFRTAIVDEISWCVIGTDRGTEGVALASSESGDRVEIDVLQIGGGTMAWSELPDEEKRACALSFVKGLTVVELKEYAPETVKQLDEASAQAALGAERDRVGGIAAAAKDRLELAMTAIKNGQSVADFRGGLADVLIEENRALKEQLSKKPVEEPPVSHVPAEKAGKFAEDSDEALKAQYDADPTLRAEFKALTNYIHFVRADKAGMVKRLGAKKEA